MAHRFNLLNPKVNGAAQGATRQNKNQHGDMPRFEAKNDVIFDRQKLNSLSRSICAIDPDDFPGLILVAGAAEAREKGAVALHLARAVAHMPGQSVFLIDADFSSPSIHTACAMALSPGLGEYLSDERPLASVIRKTDWDGLQVLTTGQGVGRESSLLSSEKMTRFVSELRAKCPDLVLVIAMDVAFLTDRVPPFVDEADGVVLALDESWLPASFAKRPIDLPKGAKLLGMIRKKGAGPLGHQSGEFNPDDTAVSFVKPQNDAAVPVSGSLLIALEKPVSFETEQFNKLTANMIQSEILNRHQVFMFTSPTSGDGKSYVTSNAAVSLARHTGKQVLVVDCDLRSPTLHDFFNVTNQCGLSTLLNGEIHTPAECIQKTCVENQYVLTAGPVVEQPLTMLSSDRMARLIDGIKRRFKDMVVILDAASPSLVADGLVVSKLADSIIIVASHKKTQKDDMKELSEKFDRGKIYGVIYNHYVGKRSSLATYKKYFGLKKAA